jgi:hypothetical protein
MPLLGHRIIEAMIIVGNAEDKSIYINMFTNTCYHTKPVVLGEEKGARRMGVGIRHRFFSIYTATLFELT